MANASAQEEIDKSLSKFSICWSECTRRDLPKAQSESVFGPSIQSLTQGDGVDGGAASGRTSGAWKRDVGHWSPPRVC